MPNTTYRIQYNFYMYITCVRWTSININKNKLYVRSGRCQTYEWHFAIFFDIVRPPSTLGSNNHFRPVRLVTFVHAFDGETTYMKRKTQCVQSKHTSCYYRSRIFTSYRITTPTPWLIYQQNVHILYGQHISITVCFIFPRLRALADVDVL